MLIKLNPQKEKHYLDEQRLIFYLFVGVTLFCDIIFITYIIILCLTYIDVLEYEINKP